MNVEKIRKDFPLLAGSTKGKTPIYFDNACMTLRPQSVVDALTEYHLVYPGCGGRSLHSIAQKVEDKWDSAREIMAKFIGAKKKEEIVFTRNTTEGINVVLNGLKLKKGDVIVTTDKEHNSVLVPVQVLKEKIGIIHKIVPSKPDNTFDLEAYQHILNETPVRLVAMVYTSNLDGVSNPMDEIIKRAHKAGAQVLVDAAQAVPHKVVNVSKLDVDFLALSGHKMLGPSGTGILFGKYNLLENLDPLIVGGHTVEFSTYETHQWAKAPDKFEAGLQNYGGVFGMAEAARYLSAIGLDAIENHEHELNQFITQALLEMPRVKIIGPQDPNLRGGIVSFYVEGADSHKIAIMLNDTAGVMVRSGQHCVHSWFKSRGIETSVRASFYLYNTLDEARVFVDSLKKILQIL